MPIVWGKGSRAHIDQLHPELQRLLELCAAEMDASFDISIVCSFRGEAEQNAAFMAGKSEKRWPESGHNKQPSRAFDFCCAGVPKAEAWVREHMLQRQGIIRNIAARHGIKLKKIILWDLPHVELA
jgi:hypothetical protein